MKIQLLSDIHLESGPFTLIDKGADVICVAGDVMEAQARNRLVGMLSRLVREVPIVVVMGNHDYLGRHEERREAETWFRRYWEESRNQVYVLQNQAVDLFGYRFLGTPLWTDWNAYGTALTAQVGAIRAQIPDFTGSIADGAMVRPLDYTKWFREAKTWLKAEIEAAPTPCVVMTHFLPSVQSVAERYQGDPLNAYFVGDCADLFGPKVPLWLHGHTHSRAEYSSQGTRVVCNPVGYRGERGREYDKDLIIEL
jgi:predicted phosphodiesterase